MRIRPGRDNPTFVFIVLVLFSFILMTFDAQRTEQTGFVGTMRSGAASLFGPIQNAVDAVTDPVFEFVSGLASIATLRQSNEALVLENEGLRTRIQEVARLENEVEQLRALVDLESTLQLDTPPVVADVTGATDDGGLFISKGSEDGIVVGMPVLNEAQALIGRIVQATERQAVVELLTHTNSAVIVDTLDGVTGYVTGTGLVGELRLTVPFEGAEIPAGTLFTTAGFDLPRGLPVGTTTEALYPLGDTITDARIEPVADFSRLPRFVLIVQALEVPGDTVPDETVPDETTTVPSTEAVTP